MNGLCDSCGAAEEDCRECKIKSKRKKEHRREREDVKHEFVPDQCGDYESV